MEPQSPISGAVPGLAGTPHNIATMDLASARALLERDDLDPTTVASIHARISQLEEIAPTAAMNTPQGDTVDAMSFGTGNYSRNKVRPAAHSESPHEPQ